MSDVADFSVLLRDNATGEERLVGGRCGPKFDHLADYAWTDGNYGCDCNRGLFFYDGEDVPDSDCGEERFTAIKAIEADGTEHPIDDAPIPTVQHSSPPKDVG